MPRPAPDGAEVHHGKAAAPPPRRRLVKARYQKDRPESPQRQHSSVLISLKIPISCQVFFLNFARTHQKSIPRPDLVPDADQIPPDLFDTFINLRESLVGSLLILPEPEDASVILFNSRYGSRVSPMTPALFDDLLESSCQIVVAKEGYFTKSFEFMIQPGKSDTITVVLEQKASYLRRFGPWGAGVLALGALWLSQQKESETEKEQSLPGPPGHP